MFVTDKHCSLWWNSSVVVGGVPRWNGSGSQWLAALSWERAPGKKRIVRRASTLLAVECWFMFLWGGFTQIEFGWFIVALCCKFTCGFVRLMPSVLVGWAWPGGLASLGSDSSQDAGATTKPTIYKKLPPCLFAGLHQVAMVQRKGKKDQ